ncbi:MAG TPA: hypothetical protein EYN91_04270 [Candidatus Melainabacteria bacterium]|jgi:hypothetical protein|nr:hypothetical protein [Candidatus Melainabacteria bacterium]HIN66158.1 hypothetical protein [Candidatus Obscuribacterales bacterium]
MSHLADVHSRTLLKAQELSSPFTAEELKEEYVKANPDDLDVFNGINGRLSLLVAEGFLVKQYMLTPKGMAYDPDALEE